MLVKNILLNQGPILSTKLASLSFLAWLHFHSPRKKIPNDRKLGFQFSGALTELNDESLIFFSFYENSWFI